MIYFTVTPMTTLTLTMATPIQRIAHPMIECWSPQHPMIECWSPQLMATPIQKRAHPMIDCWQPHPMIDCWQPHPMIDCWSMQEIPCFPSTIESIELKEIPCWKPR